MVIQLDIVGGAGLQFFGKMTASISHEIKNVMAIVNENAGLLQDFSLMTEKGRPIDPERLKTMAATVMKQIRRADEIIKNLNLLAHSVDTFKKDIELGETCAFVARLAQRFAAMRGVTVGAKPPANPVTITTCPFFLQNLIWLCLDFAMAAVGKEKSVDLIAEGTREGARIRLTPLGGLSETLTETFPTEIEKALLGWIKAELLLDTGARELVIVLPQDMDI